MSKFSLSRFEALVFLMLCGKLYFLWGFASGGRAPAAPFAAVALRDLFLGLFLAFAFAEAVKLKIPFPLKSLQWIWIFLGASLCSALFQLSQEKSLQVFLQHYMRNTWIPILVLPAAFVLFKAKLSFHWKNLILGFAALNILVSLIQFFFFPQLMWRTRPTGIVGDPLIASSFILLSFYFLPVNKWRSYLFFLPGVLVIYAASSLSALSAWILAFAAISVLSKVSINFKKVGIASALVILGIFGFSLVSDKLGMTDGLMAKVTEVSQGDHYSVVGRVNSNMAPIVVCSESLTRCLFGDYSRPNMHLVDATWASLTLNWGLFIMLGYYFVFGFLPLMMILKTKIRDSDFNFCALVFFFYWAFSFLNAAPYKHPLNLLFYVALAKIASVFLTENRDSV